MSGLGETLVLAAIAAMIGTYQDCTEPREELVVLSSNITEKVMVLKKRGACPAYCATDHLHYAHKVSEECDSGLSCNHYKYKQIIRKKQDDSFWSFRKRR
tara:strand:- start:8944 stop:9243 length:300 start_codon:yes stop_codon:yes gene_type:complete